MASEPQIIEGTKSFQKVMGGEPETSIESGDRLPRFQDLPVVSIVVPFLGGTL